MLRARLHGNSLHPSNFRPTGLSNEPEVADRGIIRASSLLDLKVQKDLLCFSSTFT